eukprot:748746-Rhodomonas_salina.1
MHAFANVTMTGVWSKLGCIGENITFLNICMSAGKATTWSRSASRPEAMAFHENSVSPTACSAARPPCSSTKSRAWLSAADAARASLHSSFCIVTLRSPLLCFLIALFALIQDVLEEILIENSCQSCQRHW